jgi:hypothetical protein
VLDAVKSKALKEGDIMDPRTEASLWPSVFKEAFAWELIAMLNATAVTSHVVQVAAACTRVALCGAR